MSTQRPPKKSDKIEARLPHPVKRAFLARCGAEGRSASEVLRRYIEEYAAGTTMPDKEVRPTMKKTLLLHAAAAALLVTGAAIVHAAAAGTPDVAAVFAALDQNSDGRLEPSELPSHGKGVPHQPPAALARLHGAGHGGHHAMAGQGHGSDHFMALDLKAAFARGDADRDGELDLVEFRRFHTTVVAEAFRRLDAAGDGVVAAAELGRGHAAGAIDRNHDGRIDAREFAAAHGEAQPG